MISRKGSHSRDKASIVLHKVSSLLKNIPGIISYEALGSYCRGNDPVGDLDILIQINSESFDIKYLENVINLSSEILQKGDKKISIVIDDIQVDLLMTDPISYIYAKTWAIGSGSFNKRMRAQAARKGYLLNEYGLYERSSKDKILGIKGEKDLFRKLGMTYRDPSER